MSAETKKLKDKMLAKPIQSTVDWSKGLSSGSTLLNLACSGRPSIAYLPGSFVFMVGDSASGKTFIAMTAFAEACKNKHFDKYSLIFDNAENGALMDLRKYFGTAVLERLESPTVFKLAGGGSTPIYSNTVEGFYFNVDNCLGKGPCIYVLDSMDALTTEDEKDKFTETRKAREKGKEVAGSYGTSKAKLNSSYLRVVFNKLRETGSILIVLCQTRDNIGFGAQFNPKTRGGGHALTFYASLEIWTSVAGHIKKTVAGKPRELGIRCKARVKKNRLTGRDRAVEFPIFHSIGMDDVGGCIDWLVDEGHWQETKGIIKAPEFDFECSAEKLAKLIDETEKDKQLRLLVADRWRTIEELCEVQRRPRYA